jgi:hypothetical protein
MAKGKMKPTGKKGLKMPHMQGKHMMPGMPKMQGKTKKGM